ncbi:MAG TPA: hypothetical protein VFR88_06655 [Microlunatus sp.]|nr:hypothetical protein [Microlunatus sp.]
MPGVLPPFPVYAWLLRHPVGPILVDSGLEEAPAVDGAVGPWSAGDALRHLVLYDQAARVAMWL